MASTRRPTRRSLALAVSTICALVALFGLTANAGAITRSGGTGTDPWIASELPDYSPGDTVTLIGGSWQPGESVHVVVNDDAAQTWSRAVDVIADAGGDIADSFTLPGWFVAAYSVTATGASSGVATSSFTDGNVRARVAGGPTSASVSWAKYTGSTTCSGTPSSTGSASVNTGMTGLGIPSGVDAGQSALLTASAVSGFTFSNWSGAASSSSTTVCVPGSSANQIDLTATYAPGMKTTAVAQPKSAIYGDASVTLTATVTPASGPAVNTGTVTFTVNGISVTSGTVSAGSASAAFSLAGLQASSYTIAATYNAGSGFNGGNNSGQTPAPALTVNKASSTTTVTCGAGPFVYDGVAKMPCTAGVSGAGGLSQSLPVGYSGNLNAGTATASAAYAGDANHNGSSDSKTFTIDKRQVMASISAADKTYDGSTAAGITGCSLESATGNHGVVSGDDVGCAASNGHFGDANAGSGKTVTADVALGGMQKANYGLASGSASTSAKIDKAGLDITAVTDSKVYDGTMDSSGTPTVSGLQAADSVDGLSQAFQSKDVLGSGNSTLVVTNYSIHDGNAGGNYEVHTHTAAGTIGAKALTIIGAEANDKPYDGTDAATVDWSGASLDGVESGDGVSIDDSTSTAHFDDKNVGQDKPVTVTGVTLDGGDAANYTATQPNGLTADITQARLDIYAVVDTKTYDGTTDSSAIPTLGNGQVKGGDSVDGLTQAFQSKNVLGPGNSTLVVTGYAIHDGNAGGNYDVHAHTAAGTIGAKGLTTTGANAVDKTYDGTDAAAIDWSGASLAGVISGDVVSLDHSNCAAHFADKNVGTGKPVTVTGAALSGADAGNYGVAQPAGLEADITPLAITGSFDSASKVYDGTVAAAASNRQLAGAIVADDVSLSGGTATFANKNVGTGKPVSLSGATLVGVDKDNYSLGSVSDAHADITARDLTVTAHGTDKTYDGTSAASVTLTTDELGSDEVSAAYASASFVDKHAGVGKPVGVSGISISGGDVGNYHLTNTSASTTATIDQRPITVTAVTDTKVYDGTTASTKTPSISSGALAAGDTPSFGEAYETRTAGTGKTLVPSGSVADGNGGHNYAVTFANNLTGVITAKPLTVAGITASGKPWDGNTSATINASGASLLGVVTGDAVSLGTAGSSGAFTSPTVGTCTVQISGLAISGGDSGNYSLTQPAVTACIGAWYATGFYAPVGIGNSQFVDAPGAPPAVSPVSTTWNITKGGSTIPLKFNLYSSLGGAERSSVADIRSFDAVKLSCATGEGEAAVDFITTGNTSLRYDGAQFIQNWKTPSASTDQCYRVNVTFRDGSSIYAFFKLRK